MLHFAQHIKNGFDTCINLLSGKVVCRKADEAHVANIRSQTRHLRRVFLWLDRPKRLGRFVLYCGPRHVVKAAKKEVDHVQAKHFECSTT